MTADFLPTPLLDRILDRLQIERPKAPTPEALADVYAVWCQKVPFDNTLKLAHLRSEAPGALPGAQAEEFFQSWLRYGAGGTCWSGAGALQAFLASLGFDAIRGIGTMLVAPDLPPNHGTVVVRFGDELQLVDSSILHVQPLKLDEANPGKVNHGAWGCTAMHENDRWHIQWRPAHQPGGLTCRLDAVGASGNDYRDRYEGTRGWSPFNYELYIRLNRGEEAASIVFGQHVTLHADGSVTSVPVTHEERNRLLVEKFGLAEELVSRLPADQPTPPPPGSRTALEQVQTAS